MKNTVQKSWMGGILAAIAASLCCIAPLLAVFGGISGAATYFNWMEPFRPYMICLTILILAIVWYQQLVITRKQQVDCCEPAKHTFWESKKFLLLITLCSGALIAFPYYSSLFYKTPQLSAATITQAKFSYVKLNIKGMSCADCTKHIDGSLLDINGVATSRTSFEKSETIVRYDPTKTNTDSINHKIKEIGYQPTLIKNN